MELLTVPEVAQRLKLSKSQVYLLCQQGRIPTITLGKSVRNPLDELEEWPRQQIHEVVHAERGSA
jgi:excisionase family DNA binding protein